MSLRHVLAFRAAFLVLIASAAPLSALRSEERSVIRVETSPQDEVIVTGRRQILPGLREIQEFNAAELAALRRRYVTPVRKARAYEADIQTSRLPEHALVVQLIAGSTPLRDLFTASSPR